VILRVQNTPVKDVADFNKLVAKLPTDKSIAMLIQRNGSPVFIAFKIDK
jgi:serine protease Do